ncbi:Protein of unknown function [Modestobacter sp. DSM 44400]|uniref:DUF559 domain-containing protein n=1 Tax=Modestobacter sp. DSM 44400 TaxID=1550230 RepID=UPI00089467A0|nr:DUF559 domain-containing protein [Modestobacter sp. DSM 44400]SDY70049.1 Protein of unknown function [Modestobacter sp. DSM 44400]
MVREHGGLATRQQLLARLPVAILDSHVSRERLQRVYPHVYAPRVTPVVGDLRLRAALICVGGTAVLSHVTALQVWGVRTHSGPVHVTIGAARRRAGAPGLVVHRRQRFPVDERSVRGLPVTSLARSIVDAWPQLPISERRPLAIDVVREGKTTASHLRDALAERPNVGGHCALAQTVDLIADGCQSELEVMGVLSVFRHPSLPRSVGQFRVRLGDGRTVLLDRAFPEAKLAIELDGARFHTHPDDRRRDLSKDAALAALGWVVLRFTYADVLRDPDGVRAKVLAVYRARVQQLSAG